MPSTTKMSATHLFLVLFALSLAVLHITNARYLGCYKDSRSPRMFDYQKNFTGNLTPFVCIHECRTKGFAYAGVEYRDHCFCGNVLYEHWKSGESSCNRICSGDNHQFCGGTWYQNVYETGYQGCFKDSPSRMLGYKHDFPEMTPTICVQYCRYQGYTFAGVQGATQCYCGNNLVPQLRNDERYCNKPCPGDLNQTCGGLWHQNVYNTTFTHD